MTNLVAMTSNAPPDLLTELYVAHYSGHAGLAVQPGVGHFSWLDDPAWFTRRSVALLG